MFIVVYFQWRPAHTLTLVYFHGRPALTLILVYFHGRPTHTFSSWSIFRGDRPTHSHGLFSRATGPHTHTVYFHGWLTLTFAMVYFHGRPTHTCLSWSIFRGDRPTHSHWSFFFFENFLMVGFFSFFFPFQGHNNDSLLLSAQWFFFLSFYFLFFFRIFL
jgi:hypothetical protein